MYEEQMQKGKLQEKHEIIANDMIGKILEFSPGDQNTIIKIIYDEVHQARQDVIDTAEKNLGQLKESLAQLGGNAII